MPQPRDPFHEFVIELFAPIGPVRIRRMFGGAGVYAEGAMFALLADESIYLKTDADLRAALASEGCEPFLWIRPSDGKAIDMGYVGLPVDAVDNAEEASRWGRRALAVALAAKSDAKPPRKRKKPAG